MRRIVFVCLLPLALSAQQQVYTWDLNGSRVLANGANLNGRTAPMEKVEEKVLEESGSRKVVERTIRTFDQTGQPGGIQKIRVETEKSGDGSVKESTTVYQADLNGRLQVSERRSKITEPTSTGEKRNETIERPTINQSFETVEKRASALVKSGETENEDTLVSRPDANGRIAPVARELIDRKKSNTEVTENRTVYNAVNGGKFEVSLQVVKQERKIGETTVTDVSIFGPASPGRAASQTPQLREQQRIESRKQDGNTIETLSIRRPSVSDRNIRPADVFQKVSERVCKGNCQ